MKRRKSRINADESITKNEVSEIEESEVSKLTSKRKVKYNNFINKNKEEIKDNKEINETNLRNFSLKMKDRSENH